MQLEYVVKKVNANNAIGAQGEFGWIQFGKFKEGSSY